MKRIKLIKTGPNKNYRPGQVIEVDDDRAKALIDSGNAEIADETAKKLKPKGSKA